MKKFATIAAIALLGSVIFPSCKKDYTCNCTLLGQTQPTKIEKSSKKDAKDACDKLNTSAAMVGGSCSLD